MCMTPNATKVVLAMESASGGAVPTQSWSPPKNARVLLGIPSVPTCSTLPHPNLPERKGIAQNCPGCRFAVLFGRNGYRGDVAIID